MLHLQLQHPSILGIPLKVKFVEIIMIQETQRGMRGSLVNVLVCIDNMTCDYTGSMCLQHGIQNIDNALTLNQLNSRLIHLYLLDCKLYLLKQLLQQNVSSCCDMKYRFFSVCAVAYKLSMVSCGAMWHLREKHTTSRGHSLPSRVKSILLREKML